MYDKALLRSNLLGGAFTFATLPSAAFMQTWPQGTWAYTTDVGPCYWNGTLWVPSSGASGGAKRAAVDLTAASTNNLAPAADWPTAYGRLILSASGASSGLATVTGLLAGTDNQRVWVMNNDATATIQFLALSGSSSAANQFDSVAGGLLIGPGASLDALYDGTLQKWLLR